MGSSGSVSTQGGSGGTMGNGASSDTVGRATDQAHRTIDKAAQAAQPVVDRLASTAHAGVDRMTGMLSGASQTMSERSRQLGDSYQNYMEQGREYVRSNPGPAIAMAVGAGFLLAKLLSRRD
jgi:ElaB/YqjD/DUF883 family membrane-anchored ribosome-binding protein